MDKERVIKHESFGIISAAHVHGRSGFMYGSDITTDSFVELTISKNSSLEYDRVMGRGTYGSDSQSDEVVAIKMTAAQFSEFITTLNISQGVPCTIERVAGEEIDQFQEKIQSRTDYEYEKLKSALKGQRNKFDEAKGELAKILSGIPKYKQEEALRIVDILANHVCANTPYHMDRLTEVVEEITATAKTEIANYIGVLQNMRKRISDDPGASNEPLQISM